MEHMRRSRATMSHVCMHQACYHVRNRHTIHTRMCIQSIHTAIWVCTRPAHLMLPTNVAPTGTNATCPNESDRILATARRLHPSGSLDGSVTATGLTVRYAPGLAE